MQHSYVYEVATPASPGVMAKGSAQGKRYTWQNGQNELAGRVCKGCYAALCINSVGCAPSGSAALW